MNKYPANWNKTTADLIAQKSGARGEEWEWAHAYELDLVKTNKAPVCDGDVFQSVQEVEIDYVTHWHSAFTGGGSTLIPKGEKLRIEMPCEQSHALSVYAVPLRYQALEADVVPISERENSLYAGYGLVIKTTSLNQYFKLIKKNRKRTE